MDKLEELGIRPVAISVDTPEVSRALWTKAGYTFTALADLNAEVIRRYDLVHAGAGVNGQDIDQATYFFNRMLKEGRLLRTGRTSGTRYVRPENAQR